MQYYYLMLTWIKCVTFSEKNKKKTKRICKVAMWVNEGMEVKKSGIKMSCHNIMSNVDIQSRV